MINDCLFSELLKGHKIEDALHEASMAKKLEAEAIQALKELQAGLQANLNSDAVSIEKIFLVTFNNFLDILRVSDGFNDQFSSSSKVRID